MATVEDRSAVQKQTKIIGRAWENTVPEVNLEGEPNKNAGTTYLTLKLNRGMSLTIDDSDRVTLWPNVKRDGINPRTNQPFVDADFNVGVLVPSEEEEVA